PIIAVLNRLKVTELGNAGLEADLAREGRMARNPFRGFTLFFSDGFLFGIGTFIFLYVSMGTFVYFLLADLMRPYDEATRGQMWAFIDLTVNTLAVLTALFVTGRIAPRLGMARTLALVPAGIAAGFAIIAAAPLLAVVTGLEIARRAGNYAITRPGREMLFTVVDRDRRFRAKPVIDIVIYRGGDALWAWAFTGLTTGIGLGTRAVAGVGACVALAWAAVAAFLGRRYDRAADEPAPAGAAPRERTLHDAKRVDL